MVLMIAHSTSSTLVNLSRQRYDKNQTLCCVLRCSEGRINTHLSFRTYHGNPCSGTPLAPSTYINQSGPKLHTFYNEACKDLGVPWMKGNILLEKFDRRRHLGAPKSFSTVGESSLRLGLKVWSQFGMLAIYHFEYSIRAGI